MWIGSNLRKFKKHFNSGGLFYAFWRGIKYFIFLTRSYGIKKRRPPEYGITQGRLRAVRNNSGISIFWGSVELTQGTGLASSINTLGIWTDSAKAHWELASIGADCFKFRVIFKELPLTEFWTLRLENEYSLIWQIDIEPEEFLHINELRNICAVRPEYKTWLNNYHYEDFPRLKESPQDICLANSATSLVGVRFSVEGKKFPALAFEPDGVEPTNLSPLVQNPPLANAGHLIGLRQLNYEEKGDFPPGYYRVFSTRIKIFDNDHLLDIIIENLRKGLLEKAAGRKTDTKKINNKDLSFLLVNLPWQRAGRWGVRAGSRWPHIKDKDESDYLPFPFFLSYATALLNKYGISASMIDAIAEELPQAEFLKKILSLNCNYLVAETSIPSFYDDLRLLKEISDAGFSIILCGPNSEIYDPQFLKNHSFIDFVLFGEYEFSLLDLARCLNEGGDLSKVKGLIFNNGGLITKNSKREPFDINLLPWPHRESVPLHKYLDAPGGMATPSVQMLASRGCPFKCQFCLWPAVIYQGNHYRVRDIVDVVDEMEYLVREKGFESVYFDDDTFNIGKSRMLEFCREIKKRGLNDVQWAIMARPDLMDEEMLKNFKEAGLWAVKYGMESTTQQLVDNIEKNMDLKKADQMIRLTQKLGIKVHVTFTFGLPGETEESVETTIGYVRRLSPFSVQFSLTTPFPGTRYHENLDRQGLIVSRDLDSYDGQHKSVIRLTDLTARDLEIAKEKACRAWSEHLRKRRGFLGDVNRFYYYLKNRGIAYSLAKSADYFVYLLFKRNKFLNPSGSAGIEEMPGQDKPLSAQAEVNAPCDKGRPAESYDILLIQCPPWDAQMPPLGIAYLSSFLKHRGIQAAICDLNIDLHNLAGNDLRYLWEQRSYDYWAEPRLFEKNWARLEQTVTDYIAGVLKQTETKYIGLSASFAAINFTSRLLKIIRNLKKEAKIILGGWGCANEHMRSLFPKDLIDVFVVGEGEQTLLEVIEALDGKKDPAEVMGAIFNARPELAYRPRLAIMSLDDIPWPTFKEFDLASYQSRALPLFTSRGCISRCSFCNDWAVSRPYRGRSAQNIFAEIKYNLEYNGASTLSFKDLLCNGNIRELNLLCNLMSERRVRVNWDSQAIPDRDMNYELLRKLRRAGCSTLIYGIESFSNNVLKGMRKLFTKEIAERVLKDTRKAGIKTYINIIVGFPGERDSDFQETCDALKRNRRFITQIGAISVCLVNHNSDLENRPQDFGIILPEDAALRPKRWHSVDGSNTYEVRRKRAERIIELAERLGLAYVTVTM